MDKSSILLVLAVSTLGAVNAEECPEDPSQDVLLPHPTCTKFYQCVHGHKVERDCGLGEHFNPTLKVCDWPHSAGCQNQSPQVMTKTEEKDKTPHPGKEEPPVKPAHGAPNEVITTPANEHAITKSGDDDKEPSPPTDEESTTQTNKHSITKFRHEQHDMKTPTNVSSNTYPSRKTESIFKIPECLAEHSERYVVPDPIHCDRFYICFKGVLKPIICPTGLYFNAKLKVCDFKEHGDGCKSNSNESSTRPNKDVITETGYDVKESNLPTEKEPTTQAREDAITESGSNSDYKTSSPPTDGEPTTEAYEDVMTENSGHDDKEISPHIDAENTTQDNENAITESGSNNDDKTSSPPTDGEPTTEAYEDVMTENSGHDDKEISPHIDAENTTQDNENAITNFGNDDEKPSLPADKGPTTQTIKDTMTESVGYDDKETRPPTDEESTSQSNEHSITKSGHDQHDMTTPTNISSNTYPSRNPKPLFKNPECLAEHSESYVVPDPIHCDRFYICFKGTLKPVICPTGLHFNAKLKVCDFQEHADGCKSNSNKPSTQSNKDVITESGNDVKESNLPTEKEPTTQAREDAITESGSNSDYKTSSPPTDGEPTTEAYEDISLHTDDESTTQDNDHSITISGHEQNDMTTPTNLSNNTYPSRDPKPQFKLPECLAEHSKRYVVPDPIHCDRFYICFKGVLKPVICPTGLYFNAKLKVCDFPEHAGSCKSNNEISITPANENEIPESGDDIKESNPRTDEEPTRQINKNKMSKSGDDGGKETNPNTDEEMTTKSNEYGTTKFSDYGDDEDGQPSPSTDQGPTTRNNKDTMKESGGDNGKEINPPTDEDRTTQSNEDETTKFDDYDEASSRPADKEPTTQTNDNIITESGGYDDKEKRPPTKEEPTTHNDEDVITKSSNEQRDVITPTTVSNSTHPSVDLKPLLEIPECLAEHGEIYVVADPKHCDRFYICSEGIQIHIICPTGLYFNEKLKACDFPEHSGGCESMITQSNEDELTTFSDDDEKPNSPTDEESTTQANENIISESVGDDRELVRPTDEESPTQVNKDAISESGDDDRESSRPTYKELTTQANVVAITESGHEQHDMITLTTGYGNTYPSTDPKQPLESPECLAEHSERYFLPDPRDCGQFYLCSYGMAIPLICPEGLYFNEKLKVCSTGVCEFNGNNIEEENGNLTEEEVSTQANEDAISESGDDVKELNPRTDEEPPAQTNKVTMTKFGRDGGKETNPPVDKEITTQSNEYESTKFSDYDDKPNSPTDEESTTQANENAISESGDDDEESNRPTDEELTTKANEVAITESGYEQHDMITLTTGYGNTYPSTDPNQQLESPECLSEHSERYFLPDPRDCGQFYLCSYGMAIPLICPEGLYFNEKLKVCSTGVCESNGNNIEQENGTLPEEEISTQAIEDARTKFGDYDDDDEKQGLLTVEESATKPSKDSKIASGDVVKESSSTDEEPYTQINEDAMTELGGNDDKEIYAPTDGEMITQTNEDAMTESGSNNDKVTSTEPTIQAEENAIPESSYIDKKSGSRHRPRNRLHKTLRKSPKVRKPWLPFVLDIIIPPSIRQ